jgi:hypothetical protein
MSVTERKLSLAVCLGLFAIAPLAYANVLDNFFLSDDFVTLARLAGGDFSPVYAPTQGGLFRPLFTLSHFLDLRLWGLNPFGFHLTNVVLHAANACLTYAVAKRLLRNDDLTPAALRGIAASAGLIFLLHPSHTEAVSWIAGRADLLAALFSLLSLLFFPAFAARGRGRRGRALAAALVSFALALLAKESAVCLPLVIFLVGAYKADARGLRARLARGLASALPFAAVLALYVAARALVVGGLVGGYGAERHLNFKHSVVVSQLLRYPLRALLPPSALQTPLLESHALSLALLAAGAALALAAAVTLARADLRHRLFARLRRAAPLWLMIALFFACLAPVINLRINVFDPQGERYLYLPSAFSSMALAYLVARLARRRPAPWPAALALLLSLYAAGLWRANRSWAEAASLSRSLLDDLNAGDAPAPGGQQAAYVLNAPDNLRGVHLYRNGLAEAARLSPRRGGEITDAHVLSYHALRAGRDPVELSRDAAGVYTLRLPESADATFERVDAAPPCVELLGRAPRELRLRFAGCPETTAIFYLTEGELRRVPPPAPPTP